MTGVAACLVGALAACSKPEPVAEPVRSVRVLTVGSSQLQAVTEYAGEVRAGVEARLGFRVSGKLVRRLVDNGERVKAGQVLAELDIQDYQLALDAAQAQVRAALSNRDLAAADAKRYKDLRDQNFISAAEFERRDNALKLAQAQLDQAQASLVTQRNQGAYTRLVADAPGVVTAIDAEAGQVLAAGTPVLRLAYDGVRVALFALPEDKLDTVRTGDEMSVRVWGSATTMTGKVSEVGGSADPQTRTFPIKVSLPDARLPLGATVTLSPKTGARANLQVGAPVIKLPTSALRQEGAATAVWVLDTANMTVSSQVVEVLTADGNEVVVTAGLQPGQQVVSAGVHVLSPGQKVVLYREKNAPAPVSATAPVSSPAAK
jgi:RND family efflux transporter MFP subunit